MLIMVISLEMELEFVKIKFRGRVIVQVAVVMVVVNNDRGIIYGLQVLFWNFFRPYDNLNVTVIREIQAINILYGSTAPLTSILLGFLQRSQEQSSQHSVLQCIGWNNILSF